MIANSADYHRQLNAQIAQYADIDDMHEGSAAAHWLNGRFLESRLREVFGTVGVVELYARYLAEAVQRSGIAEVVSLGSGRGILEIQIVSRMRVHGVTPFRITCLELSPAMVERTRDAARAAGLEQFIRAEVADLNLPISIMQPVAAFMAHHSLHHLIELEQLFDHVARWLHPEGAFIVVDMIGRNGHMRWPETLAVIRQIWPLLPDRLRWDHLFQKRDAWYENWDCSIEGFEGIRAQDILPELVRGRFKFERFFATGGLADVFYDRRFGRNFELANPLDVAFLEQIQALEDQLIANGKIKPVCLYAVMRSLRSRTCPKQPISSRGIAPEYIIRPVDQVWPAMVPTLQDTGFAHPYPLPALPALSVVHRDRPVSFGRGGAGSSLMRWGWGDPEDDFTWSLGIDSALEFTVAETVRTFDLRFIAYKPPGSQRNSLGFVLNGVQQETIDLSKRQSAGHLVRLREPLDVGATVLLEFGMSRPRRPDIDGGDDKRPIGIALVSMTAG
jgi:SAM-dependent methyltransferase